MLSSGYEGIPGRLCYLIWKIETFWHYCKQEIKQNLTVCRKMSRRAKEARLWAAFKQEVKSSNNSCFILHTSREGLWLWSAPLSPRLCAWALLEHITNAGIYFFSLHLIHIAQLPAAQHERWDQGLHAFITEDWSNGDSVKRWAQQASLISWNIPYTFLCSMQLPDRFHQSHVHFLLTRFK